jgi:drug/metabolite transporter (DMT)-like permease
MRSHDVHRVIGLAYVTPAITLALAYIFLGEKITAWSAAGILLMTTGVLFLIQST